MRLAASIAAGLAATALLAGCAAALPPEGVRGSEPLPWADATTDSVLLDAACDSGTAQACRKLAVRFFENGDETNARRALSRGCMGASGDACWRWGAAFVRSDRVYVDTGVARGLFEAGCEGGSMRACRGLYTMLLEPAPLFPEKPLREIRLSSTRR